MAAVKTRKTLKDADYTVTLPVWDRYLISLRLWLTHHRARLNDGVNLSVNWRDKRCVGFKEKVGVFVGDTKVDRRSRKIRQTN